MRKLIAVFTILGFILTAAPIFARDVDSDKAKDRAEDAKKKADRQKKKNDIKNNDDVGDNLGDNIDNGPNVGAIVGGVAVATIVGTVVAKKAGGGGDKKAATTPGTAGGALSSMDTNKDGKLSKDEFVAAMTAKFKTADKDGNGSLTREETVAAYGDQGAASFDALDKEKKGSIDLAAFNSDVERTFTWVDTDKDGFITEAERAAAAQKIAK